VLIECADTQAIIMDGLEGPPGADGTSPVIEVIDPCGPSDNGFDEVILRVDTLQGELLVAYFESGNARHLAVITPGSYRTTDKQKCKFQVEDDGSVTWK
jgi:hypothetical protein